MPSQNPSYQSHPGPAPGGPPHGRLALPEIPLIAALAPTLRESGSATQPWTAVVEQE
jgi:hypothetical protein